GLGPGQMPVFPILAATSQVWLRVDAPHLQPDDGRNRKPGRERNIESTVGIQQSRILPIQLQPFLVRQKHRHTRPVFAVVENLLGFVLLRVEIYLRLLEYRTLARLRIVAINRRRRNEAREGIERFFICSLAAESRCCPNPRQVDSSKEFSTEVMDPHL